MSRHDVESALVRNYPDELMVAVLSAALYSDDVAWAESVCLRLASHPHFNVRGNAVLGFGHIARLHRRLTPVAFPILEATLRDADSYVRDQADAAADDVEQFLGRRLARLE